jgi:biotin operon repressor
MTSTTSSAVDRTLDTLMDGTMLSAKQIASRFGVANPYDVIHSLRREGYNIELVRGSGRRVNKYVLAA